MGIDAGKSGLNFLDGLETIQCCWAKIEDMRMARLRNVKSLTASEAGTRSFAASHGG
jgi:hypothetical protein